MDSRTCLDHALFQLTPTRTRCDLVIFAGGASEKLASGLLQPFLSHLKHAKDQIQKGGYSITLRPPSTAISTSSWFTKGTLERFVRFVRTPEVLERFITLEREIVQIESSIQCNEHVILAADAEGYVSNADDHPKKSTAFSGPKGESDGSSNNVQEKSSKARLQHVLESRKAVLEKEQAMAYARALVAGFEMDCIDDLVCFADAFGASRLREACLTFMELYTKKNEDVRWVDEVAAMQAWSRPALLDLETSGVILGGEENEGDQDIMMNVHIGGLYSTKQNSSLDTSASESIMSHRSDINQDNFPKSSHLPWPHNIPPHMHNLQGAVFRQMAPYQGYLLHGMQAAPPFYPGSMPWHHPEIAGPSLHCETDNWHHKPPSRCKEKSPFGKGSLNLARDGSIEASDTSYTSDSDEHQQHGRKHGIRSSRKVVIHNINYATSDRGGEKGSSSEENSSDEDNFIDADSLKLQVEEADGSLVRHHKSVSRYDEKRDGSKHDSRLNDAAQKENGNLVAISTEGEKKNESWNIFKNILLRGTNSERNDNLIKEYDINKSSSEGTQYAIRMESERVTKHIGISADSCLMTQKDRGSKCEVFVENFEPDKNISSVIQKRDSEHEELLFSRLTEQSQNLSRISVPDCAIECSTIKGQRGGDWFVGDRPHKSLSQDECMHHAIFDGNYSSSLMGDYFQDKKNKKDVFVDDSFMVQTRVVDGDPSNSFSNTDISLVSDNFDIQLKKSEPDGLTVKTAPTTVIQPDDLCMVLERNLASEQGLPSWNPEMDYGNDNTMTEAMRSHSTTEPTDQVDNHLSSNDKRTNMISTEALVVKTSNKDSNSKTAAGSFGKSTSEVISRSKKPSSSSRTPIHKSKFMKEEENRKKMEELLNQRQKRIAERSSASSCIPAASKKTPKENKKIKISTNIEKPKIMGPKQDAKNPITKSVTNDGLAPQVVLKPSLTGVESRQLREVELKKKDPKNTTISKKASESWNKKLGANRLKPLDKKNKTKSSKVLASSAPGAKGNKDNADVAAPATLSVESSTKGAIQHHDPLDDPESIKEMYSVLSSEKNCGLSENGTSTMTCLSIPERNDSVKLDYQKGSNEVTLGEFAVLGHSTVFDGCREAIPAVITHPLSASPSKALNSAALDTEVDGLVNKQFLASHEISAREMLMPPLNSEVSPEPMHSRKKWNNGENFPKATKAFRKLLFLGLRSKTSAVN